jgi:chromosome segregation ATPase
MKTEDQIQEEKQNKQDSSRKSWAIGVCIVLLAILLGVFLSYRHQAKTEIGELKVEQAALLSKMSGNDSVINSYMGSFNQIESTIDSIKHKEGIITMMSNESRDKELSVDKKNQILKDIKYLNYLQERSKRQIAKLKRELSHSSVQLAHFEKKLKQLNAQIEESDRSITELKKQLVTKDFEIAQLNQKVEMKDEQIQLQSDVITDKQTQLNRAHYALGNEDELEKKGIITRTSGFLGMGRKTSVTSNLSDNNFQTIDIRETTIIPVEAKNVKFVSNHPEDSYQLMKKDDKVQYVQITNPANFWRYTHYAVLEIN